MALERNPAAGRAMVEAGWEVASHGLVSYRWLSSSLVCPTTQAFARFARETWFFFLYLGGDMTRMILVSSAATSASVHLSEFCPACNTYPPAFPPSITLHDSPSSPLPMPTLLLFTVYAPAKMLLSKGTGGLTTNTWTKPPNASISRGPSR